MMSTEMIALAKSLILQGAVDPMWSPTQWHLYFCEAVELLHEALVAADLDLFMVRDRRILNVDGAFPLPEDLYAVKWALTPEGDQLCPVDHTEEKRDAFQGFTLINNALIVVNRVSPDAVTIDYVKLPKEIPVWTGTGEPSGEQVPTYTPDWPLSTPRAGRVIARIMQHLARADDDSASAVQMQHAKAAADRFVDRLLSRKQFE